MAPTTLNFIRAALVYAVVGVILGVVMNIRPEWGVYLKTSHAHINLVGFVSMFIFGVAYHILPRFRGKPLHSERLATLQLWLSNIGLLGMAFFMPFYVSQGGDILKSLVAAFGIVEAIAFLTFTYNLGRTL